MLPAKWPVFWLSEKAEKVAGESLAGQRVAITVGFIPDIRIGGEHLLTMKWSHTHQWGFCKMRHTIPLKKMGIVLNKKILIFWTSLLVTHIITQPWAPENKAFLDFGVGVFFS